MKSIMTMREKNNMQTLKLVISDRSKPLWAINDKGQTLFRKITEHGTQFMTWERKKDALKIIDAINTHGLEYVEEKLGRKAYLENVMVTGGIPSGTIKGNVGPLTEDE